MARRSNYLPLLAGLLVLVIVVGIAAYTVHRANISPLLRLPLVVEESGKIEVARGTVYAGYVYNVSWTPSGWAFKAKQNTRLVEKLTLSNVDLQPGDAVSWHGWDWRVKDSSISYSFSGVNVTSAWSFVAEWKLAEVKGVNPIAIAGYRPIFLYHRGDGRYRAAFVTAESGTEFGYEYAFGVAEAGVWYFGGSYYTAQGVLGVFDETSYSETTHANTTQNHYGQLNIGYGGGWNLDGWVAYAIVWNQKLPVADLQAIKQTRVVPSTGIAFFADPTWWNGTHYVDLVGGETAAPATNTYRVPAETPWLWLVKNLASDGKLHLKYFPPNTVIRVKDSSGNVIREWTVPEVDANAAGLVEDYPVDLAADILTGVTLEASVPAQKARIYGPPGFTIRVEAQSYSMEYIIGSEGYVDVPLEGDSATVVLLANTKSPQLGISVYEADGKLKVQVYNASNGVALSGAVVIAKKNNEAASATTDENGFATLNIKPDASVTIEAYYLSSGVVFTGSSVYMPPPADYDQPLPETSNNKTATVLLALLLLLLLATIMLRRGRR